DSPGACYGLDVGAAAALGLPAAAADVDRGDVGGAALGRDRIAGGAVPAGGEPGGEARGDVAPLEPSVAAETDRTSVSTSRAVPSSASVAWPVSVPAASRSARARVATRSAAFMSR